VAKQANRMMIGGFVVVAVVLLATSLVVFGSGKFFKKTEKYVLYFDGSIKGLSGRLKIVERLRRNSLTWACGAC
jgi:paraquat-inducible protein B